ncbi:MAG: transposase [Algoriphagus aquaeductus]|uniref:transposase n=1 Tax=Algoriphagus aquaeductus TaxID=475299 RepID=UPI0039187CD2
MGEAYQIKDQEMPYFLTFQVVGWADAFTRKIYRDFILENLTYSRKEKGLYLYGFVIMSNHIHLVAQQKDGKLSDWVRDFKKFTSKKLLKLILENPQEMPLRKILHLRYYNLGHSMWQMKIKL